MVSRQTVSLRLPIPPSTNQLWRHGRKRGTSYRSPEYVRWIANANILAAMQNKLYGVPTDMPVEISLTVHEGRGWRGGRDLDNVLKAVLDWLAHHRYIVTDNWKSVQKIMVKMGPVEMPARIAFVQVEITPMESEAVAELAAMVASEGGDSEMAIFKAVTHTTGDTVLVTGQKGVCVRVVNYVLTSAAGGAVSFKSGSTAITGALTIAANGQLVASSGEMTPSGSTGLFQTAPGESLVLSGTVEVSGHLAYQLVSV